MAEMQTMEKGARVLGYCTDEVVCDLREPIFKRPFDLFLSGFGLLLLPGAVYR
jgi:hypothetical protein